jgi:hypothetical protein
MSIVRASKKKLAIMAVALALGAGTLATSAEACWLRSGHGWTAAGAGYGFRPAVGWGWRHGGWGWRHGGWGRHHRGWRHGHHRGWGWRQGHHRGHRW